MPKIVFPVPGVPDNNVELPLGIPPWTSLSNPLMPVFILSILQLLKSENQILDLSKVYMNIILLPVSIFWHWTLPLKVRLYLSCLGTRKYFVASFLPLWLRLVSSCELFSEKRNTLSMCPFSCFASS